MDQGRCAQGATPTTDYNPDIPIEGVNASCLATTSTFALVCAMFPGVPRLVGVGYKVILESNGTLARGLNGLQGKLGRRAVTEGLGMDSAIG
jgi:alanine dehydrogenase